VYGLDRRIVTGEQRQALLREFGLTEDADGCLGLTIRGLQQGTRRAYELRAEGNRECAEILALDAADERRARLALGIQADAFSASVATVQDD
jgi:hypothetical protein